MNDSTSKFWSLSAIGLLGLLLLLNRYLFLGPALHLRIFLIAFLPLISFYPFANGTVARMSGPGVPSRIEAFVYSSFLAFSFASAFAFFLLTIQLAEPIVFQFSSVVLFLSRWLWWKEHAIRLWSHRNICQGKTLTIEGILLTCTLLILLAAAVLPPLGYDAHEYHLAVPQTYLNDSGWVAFPYNVYAAFPMNVELIYLWPIASNSSAGCTIINLQFALITAFALYALSQRWGMTNQALLAPLVFLTTGLTVRLVLQANIDLALSASAVVLLLAYERYRQKGSAIDLILMAVALGFALGSKYIAILSIAFPFGVMVVSDAISSKRNRLLGTLAFILIAGFFLFSPWLIRNLILYRNPFYPLFVSILGGEPSFFTDVFRKAHSSPQAPFLETLGAFLITPLKKVFWEPSLKIPQFTCLWLLGIPALFAIRKDHPILRVWIFLGAAYLAWFFATQRNDRFLASAVPLMALVPGYALSVITNIDARRIARIAILGIVFIQLWFSIRMTLSGETIEYLLSPSFEEAYLVQRLPHYRAIDWLNRRKGEEGTITAYKPIENVLFIGEAQSYGAAFHCTVPTVFNHHPLENGLPSGTSHILYNGFELDRLRKGYGPLGWSVGDRLQAWIDSSKETRLKPVFDAYPERPGRIVVYEIKN